MSAISRTIIGDCRAVLPTLEAGSVQTCVTSPPYWGLRDYGTATWEGGDVECDHIAPSTGGKTGSTLKGSNQRGTWSADGQYRQSCGKCGAHRIDAQIGLESTPAKYVEKMVAVFREVRRVLRDDGTLWLNLGDSYANYRTGYNGALNKQTFHKGPNGKPVDHEVGLQRRANKHEGLKEKDLVGIPWRVAFALQADGWYLRQDIIWAKPNPMPESVRDRCTKSHEYLFLLAKSERYYYDAAAIAEESITPLDMQVAKRNKLPHAGQSDPGGMRETTGGFDKITKTYETRNKRSVWTVATQPYSEAHFATFPPALIEPCILAGCPPGGLVLDPFGGSGTTGQVAEALGRKWLLIELNGEYGKLCADRTQQIGMELA